MLKKHAKRRSNIDDFCQRQSRYLRSLDKKPHIHAVGTFPIRSTCAGNAAYMYIYCTDQSFQTLLIKKEQKTNPLFHPFILI